MKKNVICAALAQHFGHREWTLIGNHKVQLDGSDDTIEISTLNIEALISDWDDKAKNLERIGKLKQLLIDEPVGRSPTVILSQSGCCLGRQ